MKYLNLTGQMAKKLINLAFPQAWSNINLQALFIIYHYQIVTT